MQPSIRHDQDVQATVTPHLAVTLALIAALAFLIRAWGVSALGDLYFDEQASYFIASMSLPDMFRYLASAPFEHPPAFYLLFHGWLHLVGSTEVAMRSLSVLIGTATVALLGMVVARAAGVRAGVVAAAALAVLPLHVYYSRDARMYPLLALLVTGMLAFALAPGGGFASPRRMLAAGAVGVSAVGTHYLALFVVGGFLAGLIPWALRARAVSPAGYRAGPDGVEPAHRRSLASALVSARGSLAVGAATALVSLALLALWFTLSPGLRVILEVARPRPVSLDRLGAVTAEGIGAALSGPFGVGGWVLVGALVFGGAAAIALRDPAGGQLRWLAAGMFLLTGVGIPLLVLLGGAFAPRYVAMATPTAAALLALALYRVHGVVIGGALSVLAVASILVLAPFYAGYVRSDYGVAMEALRERARPTDAIVLNGPWQDILYRRYGWGLPPHYFVTSRVPTTQEEAVPRLQELAAAHPRLWVVDSATDLTDPEAVVVSWLDAHAFPAPVVPFQNALLRPYLTASLGDPAAGRSLDVQGLDVQLQRVALDRWRLAAGDESRLLVRTSAPADGGPRRMLARLVDEHATSLWHWDGALEPTRDGLRFGAAITIPVDARPGPYTLEALIYEPEGPRGAPRVRHLAPAVELGVVEVTPRSR